MPECDNCGDEIEIKGVGLTEAYEAVLLVEDGIVVESYCSKECFCE